MHRRSQLTADCDLAAGLERQETERIHADDLAHFLNRAVMGEKLVAFRNIRAEEAGMTEWWCRNSHVNLSRACIAQQLYQTAAGRTADDGVIDHDHALALNGGAQGIQLETHRALALVLTRLDKVRAI